MNLTKRNYLLIDYYNLRNLEDGYSIVELLNAKDLDSLICPILLEIIDGINSKIENETTDIHILQKDYTEIDDKLREVLIDNSQFINIQEESIKSKLFSFAINKIIRRIFNSDGINNEKYQLQSHIQDWIEDNLAKALVKDNRFKSYDKIIKLIEITELLHQFYTSFKRLIPIEWINSDFEKWTSAGESPQNLLEHVRTFDSDYFVAYSEEIKKYQDYSPWKYMKEATRYSDHAYFNHEYSFKNSVLIEKDIFLWLKFWDNLKFPILQDMPFHRIQNPKDIIRIAIALHEKTIVLKTEVRYLMMILMNNFFKSIINIDNRLSYYINSEQLSYLTEYEKDETILSLGKVFYQEWKEEKEQIHKEFIENVLKIINVRELSEWVFSYSPKPREARKEINIYNEELELLIKCYNDVNSNTSFDIQLNDLSIDFNFQKFNFLVNQFNSKKANETDYTKLITLICDYIKSDKFFWDNTFSPAYWSTFKNIGFLISLTNKPSEIASSIIEQFRVKHEGWNVPLSDYDATRKESFMYCGIILLLEHKKAFKTVSERNKFFKYIMGILLNQSRFSTFSVNDYKLPLYLLSFVVNQIYKNLKITYELDLINNLDSIQTIIEILSNDTYVLESKTKKLLLNRISIEIPFEKRKLLQRGQKMDLSNLETNIEKLGLKTI